MNDDKDLVRFLSAVTAACASVADSAKRVAEANQQQADAAKSHSGAINESHSAAKHANKANEDLTRLHMANAREAHAKQMENLSAEAVWYEDQKAVMIELRQTLSDARLFFLSGTKVTS